jgi:hypothetical protein
MQRTMTRLNCFTPNGPPLGRPFCLHLRDANNLGIALWRLGERESRTAKLKEAVSLIVRH